MQHLKCPDCGAQQFYVKDPDDRYTISDFSLETGTVAYLDNEPEAEHITVSDDTEIFCNQCAWHDKFNSLKRAR